MSRRHATMLGLAVLWWTGGVIPDVWAATALLAWDRPTVYANGAPLPARVPLEYRVWWGRQSRGTATDPEAWRYPKVRTTRSTRFTVTSVPKGQTCFAVTARDPATDEESAYSHEVCKKF